MSALSEPQQFEVAEEWTLPVTPAEFMAWLRNALPDALNDDDRLRLFATYPASRHMPLALAEALGI